MGPYGRQTLKTQVLQWLTTLKKKKNNNIEIDQSSHWELKKCQYLGNGES